AVVLTAAIGALAAAALGAGSLGWVVRDRAARQTRLTDDLRLVLERAEVFQEGGKRAEALAAIERAAQVAGEAAPEAALQQRLAALQERLAADAQDKEVVAQFEEIRLREQSR